jgi:hypothetical protein
VRMSTSQPRTLADDLRSRTDAELVELLTARPDLVNPIPSDMRALTTRAATAPSISRFLDDVDAVHHYALRIACALSDAGPTSTDVIVKATSKDIGAKSRAVVSQAVDRLWSAALLWGNQDKVNVITAVRDQVMNAPVPSWPPPTCSAGAVADDEVEAQAALHARRTLSVIEEVCERWRRDPGSVLRSGGLSTRAADALADSLGIDRFELTCAIDVAHAAGLIAIGSTPDDVGWMPTEAFDAWCDSTPARRWAALVQAWLNSGSVSSDRPLAPDEHPFIAPWRRQMLLALTDSRGGCELKTVVQIIDFRWPRRAGKKRASVIETLWREAVLLGVVAFGNLTQIGHCAVEGVDVATMAKKASGHVVAESDHVHVQADHTIIAPGPLRPAIGHRLREIADIESRGHATVLRLTPTSIKRALEVEPDADVWIEFLDSVSTKALPQPVAYMISDAARTPPASRPRLTAPPEPAPRRRFRTTVRPAVLDRAVRVLRAQESRESISPIPSDVDVPKMESATVVAQLRYSIDHNETIHLTHVESDGSTAVLLVDPIRLGGGSLTAYDHHAEQVRTLAVSRINGIATLQISA